MVSRRIAGFGIRSALQPRFGKLTLAGTYSCIHLLKMAKASNGFHFISCDSAMDAFQVPTPWTSIRKGRCQVRQNF